MSQFKPLPSRELLLREFVYEPDTGLFRHAYYKCGRAVKGQVAGAKQSKGYIMLRSGDYTFMANRAAWLIGHGVDPGQAIVDHIDLDKSNNRLSNLRLATDNQNQWNRVGRGYHKTGERFRACIRHLGHLHHIGTYDTAEEAQAAYRAKAVELRGEFVPRQYVCHNS